MSRELSIVQASVCIGGLLRSLPLVGIGGKAVDRSLSEGRCDAPWLESTVRGERNASPAHQHFAPPGARRITE
ncbi:MAG: hypothetical protein KDA96_05020 [Planctomycetaceae bacterium]|nr:hypothetical protein [Planctomycetaceae bacterium]